jgi:RNA polymerase sigma-70 factor (ECF subfamily)
MEMKKMSDAQLVSLYQSNDERAFKMLVNRYKSKVYTTIYFIVKDRDLANDITQDTFFKLVDTIRKGKYKEDGKFKQWLLRMAHNMAIDSYRKTSRYHMVRENDEFSIFDTLPLGVAGADVEMDKKDIRNKIREHIKQLPKEQKQVLIMRHFAGMSFQEIANTTGVSINTALGRMRYALLNLRKQLNPYFAYEQNYYP